jgi:hypothetical protein
MSPDPPQSSDMAASAIRPSLLFIKFFIIIICLFCPIIQLTMCVMHINKENVINFPFQGL